jgi:dTDP-4-dehydrorhamnose 3,5-epimerase
MPNLIKGLEILALAEFRDHRGSFSRLFDINWLPLSDIQPQQINISRNSARGTLRGMHYQLTGIPEHKLITVLSGSVYIVVIDLRKDSDSYLNTFAAAIDSRDLKALFVPAGCATGWITLEENTDLHYVMSSRFEDCTYSGLRFDDSFFKLKWPAEPKVISDQDISWPNFIPESSQS